MCEIYVPTKPDNNPLTAIALGGLCVLGVFALIPLLQGITNYNANVRKVDTTETPSILPDAIIEPDIPAPEPDKTLDKPELEEPLVMPTLEQLEQLLNPTDGGASISIGITGITTEEKGGLEIFLPVDLDNRPRVLMPVKPLIPYEMRGIRGSVTVEFVIDAEGKVLRPRIHKSTHWQFEQAAIEAIKRSKWEPGIRNGEKVASIVHVPIEFKK